jgi:hypothetical protein
MKFQCRYLCLFTLMYLSVSLFWIPIPSDGGKYITRIYDSRNEDWRSVSSEIPSTSKYISSCTTLKTEKLCSRRRTITRLWLLFCSSDGLPAKLIGGSRIFTLNRLGENFFHVGKCQYPSVLHLSSCYSYLLTPCSRVLHEKLIGLQLVKIFPTFYGTWRFITAFKSAGHLSLSRASSILSMPHIPLPENPS